MFVAWVIDAADSTIYSLTLPMIKDEFGLDLTTMGAIASVFLVGTVLGSLILPILADRKGRRVGIATCVGLFSVATCAVGMAGNLTTTAIGRFFTGCGTGAEWPIGAAYVSEVVEPKKRGWAMGIMQSGYPVGFFLAGLVFLVFESWFNLGWRACYFVLVIPDLATLIPVMTMLRESPTWLKTNEERNRTTEATGKKDHGPGYRALFTPKYLKSTFISTALHCFGVMYAYGIVVWLPGALSIDFGMDNAHVSYFTLVAWAVGTLEYLLAGRLPDVYGRRLVLAGYMLIGLVAVALLNYMLYSHNHSVVAMYGIGCLIGISVGVTVLYITYSSEIYVDEVRTVGLGFSVAIGKVTAVITPTLLGFIAKFTSISLSLLVSTALGMLMIPIIFFGPETAGKDLMKSGRKRRQRRPPDIAKRTPCEPLEQGGIGIKITNVEVFPFKIPNKRVVVWAVGSLPAAEHLIVKITAEDGSVGVSKAIPRPMIYGETQEGIYYALTKYLKPMVVGEDSFNFEGIWKKFQFLPWNLAAKGAIDVALYDLNARSLGISVARLLGGPARKEVVLCWQIGFGERDEMIAELKEKLDEGYRAFKVKGGPQARKVPGSISTPTWPTAVSTR
ncbi:MFS transporter [Breoghania sp.]|uniref:MFS transporter n=1 Tax=Breoghania sp. TaxID=2065378 RepID=UPI002636790E|nr:MFS transporter [Breoghania sp.]MDJ0931701.1 MFS transporter [Breoghania sp.]